MLICDSLLDVIFSDGIVLRYSLRIFTLMDFLIEINGSNILRTGSSVNVFTYKGI